MTNRRPRKRKRGLDSHDMKVALAAVLIFAVLIGGLKIIYSMVSGPEKFEYHGLTLGEMSQNTYNSEYLFWNDYGFRHYDDGEYTSVMGIDVSYAQGSIDWGRVKDNGIDFAMIRLGYRGYKEGKIHLDDFYRYNIQAAETVEMPAGVYFFSQAINTDEAIEEAEFVIKNLKDYKIDLPVAFDMEDVNEDGRIYELSAKEKTEIADAFCQVIKEAGYEPMIYDSYDWLMNEYDMEYLSQYPTWMAHYGTWSSYPYEYRFWQYTSKGHVDGIEKKVDLNLWFRKVK